MPSESDPDPSSLSPAPERHFPRPLPEIPSFPTNPDHHHHFYYRHPSGTLPPEYSATTLPTTLTPRNLAPYAIPTGTSSINMNRNPTTPQAGPSTGTAGGGPLPPAIPPPAQGPAIPQPLPPMAGPNVERTIRGVTPMAMGTPVPTGGNGNIPEGMVTPVGAAVPPRGDETPAGGGGGGNEDGNETGNTTGTGGRNARGGRNRYPATKGGTTGLGTTTLEIDMSNKREIGPLAHWSVSSHKPGFGIESLVNPDLNVAWQSEGPQPHILTIQFPKRMSIASLCIYLNAALDESYTPHRMSIRAGTYHGDLQEVRMINLKEPKGWISIPLRGDSGEDGEKEREREEEAGRWPRCNLIQIVIISNHLSGRDTRIRGIRIFSPKESEWLDASSPFPFTSPEMRMHRTIR